MAAYHTAVHRELFTRGGEASAAPLKVENDHKTVCCPGCPMGCGSEELFMGDVEVLSVKVAQSPATFRGFAHHSIYVHLNY